MRILNDKEILERITPEGPCMQNVAEAQHKQDIKDFIEWLVSEKKNLSNKKEYQSKIMPADIQSQVMMGGKIKAFQQMIDKVSMLK